MTDDEFRKLCDNVTDLLFDAECVDGTAGSYKDRTFSIDCHDEQVARLFDLLLRRTADERSGDL